MRWIVRLFSVLLMLVIVAVAVVLLIPTEKVAEAAARQFNTLTGRVLTISGSVRPSVWPQIGVKTGAVTISNAAWSTEGPMLQADGLEIGLDMAALWEGTVKITRIEAQSPQIVLERSKDGLENWVFGGAGGGTVTTETPGVDAPFTLDMGVIRSGALTYIDHGAGTRVALSDIDAEGAFPVYDGPATVKLSAVMNGQPLSMVASASEFSTLLSGRVVPVDVAVAAGAARLGFLGRIGTGPLTAEGKLDADLADLAAVSALAGEAAPALPAGLGASSVAVTGAVTLTDAGAIYLRGARAVLDGNILTGDVDFLTAGARPQLSAQLAAGALTLSGLTSGGGDGDSGTAAASGWSRETIDVSGLGALDATVALSADSLDLGTAKLGATRVLMTLERGRAVFDLRQIAAYGGTVTGQFVVNARGGLSLGGDLRFAGLAMQPLLTDLAGYDRLLGTGDVALKFLSVGNSMDALMKSLSGSGRVSFGKGELRGLDIAGMLRTLDTGYVGEGAKTIFDEISAGFTIAGGVLSNQDMKLVAPLLTASGAGAIGIGARTLDYRVQPVALANADGSGGLTVPLLITGSWENPKFRLDLESLAREKFEAEAKALEEKARAQAKALEASAKARLAQKAQDELGLTVQDGETVETAAKRRAEQVLQEETTRALQNLLGGN